MQTLNLSATIMSNYVQTTMEGYWVKPKERLNYKFNLDGSVQHCAGSLLNVNNTHVTYIILREVSLDNVTRHLVEGNLSNDLCNH